MARQRLNAGQPGGSGSARFRFDRGINLVKVFRPTHHFQGLGILSQNFIEPILVGGRQHDAAALHGFGVYLPKLTMPFFRSAK